MTEIKNHRGKKKKKTFSKWSIFLPFGSKTVVKVDVTVVSALLYGSTPLHHRKKHLEVFTAYIVVACDFLLSVIKILTLGMDFLCLMLFFTLTMTLI